MERQCNRAWVSWTAIFSAAIAGVGLNFLANLLFLGLGIASFSVGLSGKTAFSLFGFFCFALSAIVVMFLTGWIAGRLTPALLPKCWGFFYGFLAWSLLLIFTIILITNAIQYASFHSNFTSNLVSIKLTSNSPMMTETSADSIKKSPLDLKIESQKKEIVANALLTFIFFFIGAIASCIGGLVGYKTRLRNAS